VIFKDAIAVVPNLAIPLNRQANEGFSVLISRRNFTYLCGAEMNLIYITIKAQLQIKTIY